jgi:hypothetical protein
MEGTTRTGYCLLAADASQLEAIAVSLNMGDPRPIGQDEAAALPAFLPDSPCLAHFSSVTSVEVLAYLITGRSDQLRLADGGQFEYMFIAFAPPSEEACVEASYAYG